MDKSHIIASLRKHIAGRSGMDFRNYNDRASAMEDYRKVLKHGKDARAMLRVVELSGMTAEDIIDGFSAFSGRLSYTEGKGCDYCTGQYYATEYRAAACAVLAQVIWQYVSAGCNKDGGEWVSPVPTVKSYAKRNLGRGIAARWFN